MKYISVAMSKSLLVVFVAASILENISSSESSGRMVKPCTSSHAEARDYGCIKSGKHISCLHFGPRKGMQLAMRQAILHTCTRSRSGQHRSLHATHTYTWLRHVEYESFAGPFSTWQNSMFPSPCCRWRHVQFHCLLNRWGDERLHRSVADRSISR